MNGIYGKLPSLGDFVTRNLSASFRDLWDDWLGGLVRAASQLPGDWPDAWLEAPVWHFALGAGIAGPTAAHGVLLASTDRVGRLFPFTIVGTDTQGGLMPRDWAPRAEAVAIAALDDDAKIVALEQALQRLGPPGLADIVGSQTACLRLPENPGDYPDALIGMGAPRAGETQWWCRGTPRVPGIWFRWRGLPSPELSGCMIHGSFPDAM